MIKQAQKELIKAIIDDNTVYYKHHELIDIDLFPMVEYKDIFNVVQKLIISNETTNIINIGNELKKNDLAFGEYLEIL